MQYPLPGNTFTLRWLGCPLFRLPAILGNFHHPLFTCQEALVYISIQAHTIWMHFFVSHLVTEPRGSKNGALYCSAVAQPTVGIHRDFIMCQPQCEVVYVLSQLILTYEVGSTVIPGLQILYKYLLSSYCQT